MAERVCFVCGSYGAGYTVHVKAREKGPYYPFLEHHDPPKGVRPPRGDGSVDSCRVCSAFLNQQWDSYEANKTPSLKRLYWLKRADDGPFTGAEMRVQGEYAAQVMGLAPGAFGISASSTFKDYSSGNAENSSSHVNSNHGHHPVKLEAPESNGVLDLTAKPKSRRSRKDSTRADQKMTCFLCGSVQLYNQGKYIYASRSIEGEPFFPFLRGLTPPPGAIPISPEGWTRVCSSCSASMCQQWKAYENAKIPLPNRTYRVNDEPVSMTSREPVATSRKSVDSDCMDFQDVCYLCGQVYHKDSMKLLHTSVDPGKQIMYFPFIAGLQRPPKSRPIDGEGRVMGCRTCWSYLQRQWHVQQAAGVPVGERRYVMRPVATLKSSPTSQPVASPSPSSGTMVVNSLGQPLNIHISSTSPVTTTPASSAGLLAIAQNLPTQMAASLASMPGVIFPYMAASLAATTTLTPATPTKTPDLPRPGTAPIKQEPLSLKLRDQGPVQLFEHTEYRPDVYRFRHDKTTEETSYCFLCGHGCGTQGPFVLQSLPRKDPDDSRSAAFFPFLSSRDPAPYSERIKKDGTVQVCVYCHANLMSQWERFEARSVAYNMADSKVISSPWLRHYVTNAFPCCVCGADWTRARITTISSKRFCFLKELPKPDYALVLDKGRNFVVCVTCEQDLSEQYVAFEKQHAPEHLRFYNIRAADADYSDNFKESRKDSTDSLSSKESLNNGSGLPPGAKGPPLSLISPAAKVTRTAAATAPPMNQASPPGINTMGGNSAMAATRNSSFAAALRKLAKQAGDAAADPNLSRDSGRESSPGSTTATSPRAPTPKRAPPPLVFNNSQSNAINSPPVVTIAPTLAHSHLVAGDGRKSVERSSVVQSIGPMIEPLNVKQERDKMAPSIGGQERRDDDRPQSKDSAAKLPGHPVLSSASSHREENARGFQPYRPGDDIRAHLAGPAFPPGLDHPAYAAYHQAAAAAAFMQPQSFPHPAFRFDDPLLLERYRLMQPHFLPYPHPGMLAAQGVPGLLPPGSRYPPELLGQHFGLISPGAKLPSDHRSPGAGLDRSKSEEEIRRERTEAERKEREREIERERERERREREERERIDRERQERERAEKERQMRERMERERIEREREQERERERERQMSLERLRMEVSREQPSPAHRQDDPAGRYTGSIMHGTPRDNHYPGDKFRMNALISREEEARWLEQHRHPQLPDKERDRQYMHQQFLREQDMLMRERDRRLDLDKHREREKSGPTPITIKPKEETNSHNPSSFHRPFERTLANGYERNHFSEYERRLMTDKILAHDRQLLQERSRSRSESSQDANCESSESRRTETPGQDRVYLDKGHEGIPARLLDNDGSSHLLPPAHLPPAQTLNQYDYDRPHAEYSYMSNSHKQEVKDPHFYNYLHKEVAPSVISSLDYEEQKIRQARQNGTYESEESDSDNSEEFTKEERHQQRLLLISEGPPLKARKSRKKNNFLNMFKLTTADNRKELDFERLCKKRRLYKEPSVSPVELENTERNSPLNYPPRVNPESLNHAPDYKYKMRFLFDLKLQVVPSERRKQMEQIREAIELDRRRRLFDNSNEERAAPSPLRKHLLPDIPVLNHQASPTGIKRKHHEMEGPSLEPVPSNGPDPSPRISLSQLQERHAAATASSLPGTQPSQHPPLISHDQGHPPLAPGQGNPPPGQGQGHPPHGSGQGHSPEANHVIQPPSGPEKEHQHRNLAREFAQEFHESVLQSTRKQELVLSRPNRPDSEVRYHMDDRSARQPERPSSAASSHMSIPQSKLDDLACSERSQDSLGSLFKWPGVEAVIESYHRHIEEQRLEKNVLADQCSHLQQKNADLHQTVEQLHRQYSELMQANKAHSEQRVQAQSALDNLNKCLKLLR